MVRRRERERERESSSVEEEEDEDKQEDRGVEQYALDGVAERVDLCVAQKFLHLADCKALPAVQILHLELRKEGGSCAARRHPPMRRQFHSKDNRRIFYSPFLTMVCNSVSAGQRRSSAHSTHPSTYTSTYFSPRMLPLSLSLSLPPSRSLPRALQAARCWHAASLRMLFRSGPR